MGIVDDVMQSAIDGASDEHTREVVHRVNGHVAPLLFGAYATEMRLPGATAHSAVLGLCAAHATALSTIIHRVDGGSTSERASLVRACALIDEQMLRAFVRRGVGRD